MLSSRHDMAVRHKLKPNQNPCMNKERDSEARFLAEDTLRAECCWEGTVTFQSKYSHR